MRKGILAVGLIFVGLILISFSTGNVSAPSGMSITLSNTDRYMSGTDHQATFLITVTNNEASGSHHVFLTLEDIALPSGSQWDSPPLAHLDLPKGWTYSFSPSELDVDHGQSKQSTLTIIGTAGTPPGGKTFIATGYWVAYVLDDPVRYVYTPANAWSNVMVLVKLMIPEYLLGTAIGLAGMFGAFGAYYFRKRKQFSP